MLKDESGFRPAARPGIVQRWNWLAVFAGVLLTAPARAADGTWAEIGPPLLDHMAVVYDAARDRLLMFGGASPDGIRNDVWALPLRSHAGWSLVAVAGTPPAPRLDPSALYDAVGNRVFVAGGSVGDGGPCFADLWTLELSPSPHWVQWSPGAGPVARSEPRLGIDRARDRLEYFGGRDASGTALSDAWTLDLSSPSATWQTQPVAVEGRNNISAQTFVVPAMRGPWTPADTLAGTISASGGSTSDGWLWLVTYGDSLRCSAFCAGVYCNYLDEPIAWTADGQLVRFYHAGRNAPGDWTRFSLTPGGEFADRELGDGSLPYNADGSGPWMGRIRSAAIYDPVAHRVLFVQGERDQAGSTPYPDGAVLSLDLTPTPNPWSHDDPAAPVPGSAGHEERLALDTTRDRLLQFGGASDNWSGAAPGLWSLAPQAGGFWTRTSDSSCVMPYLGLSVATDPVRDEFVMAGTGPTHSGVRILPLSGATCATDLAVTGAGPNGVAGSLVYDSLRDRYWIFGGGGTQAEAWSFDPHTLQWRREASGDFGVVPWEGPDIVYDAATDRFVLTTRDADFGGHAIIDTWSPSQPGGWSTLWQSPVIGEPRLVSIALDGARHRLLVGDLAEAGADGKPIVWEVALDGSGASRALDVSGPAPIPADRRRGVYDAAQDCLMVGPGGPGSGSYWTLQFGGAVTPVLVSADECTLDGGGAVHVSWSVGADPVDWSVGRSADGGSSWDVLATRNADEAGQIDFVDAAPPSGARVGYRLSRMTAAGRVSAGETWIAVPAVGAAHVPELALAGAQPARGAFALTVRLAPNSGPASLRILDARGRVAFTRRLADGGAPQSVSIGAGSLGSGVYFAQLVQGSLRRTQRFVHLR